MFKQLCLLFFMVFCISCSSTSRNSINCFSDSSNPGDSVYKHTVSIQVGANGLFVSAGSGTLVRHEQLGLSIITAAHVALGINAFDARACSIQEGYEEECVKLTNPIVDLDDSIATDWAIYSIQDKPKGTTPACVSLKPQTIGDTIWQAGVPDGQPWVSKGTVAWIVRGTTLQMYMIDGFASPGSSGSGIYDSNGRLIAITVAICINELGPSTNQIYAVPISNLRLF